MPGYNNLSDLELTDLLKSGDHAAYTELYQRYFRLLYTFAYKKLRDTEQASDIIQDFFTMLWNKRQEQATYQQVSSYFFTAVNRRIIDHFLHQEVEAKYVASFSAFLQAEEKTDHLARENQLMALIEKEIAALPPKMREVFELSRKAHRSHKEIAGELGISEKTVDRQISNALKVLRTKLGLLAWLLLLIRY